jgi:hypothetical protein
MGAIKGKKKLPPLAAGPNTYTHSWLCLNTMPKILLASVFAPTYCKTMRNETATNLQLSAKLRVKGVALLSKTNKTPAHILIAR